jgi:propanol-preferring alcohol dehydrogenase
MVLHRIGKPLELEKRPVPQPGAGEILVRVEACAVCRTDLHVVDGELSNPKLPLVPGHEIVGIVEAAGGDTDAHLIGKRVGIPWLAKTCGECEYCRTHRENLCDRPVFTGYTRDGGFATHTIAAAVYCFPLEETDDPVSAAPLMCAGLIGWRSLRMAGDARRIGFYGFGAAAHILAQICHWQGRQVFAFTRPGDEAAQQLARSLGAAWAGSSEETPPARLDAAIIFAPDGRLVPLALAVVGKGGRVVCGGIYMSDIPGFPYRLLWEERQLLSVANLTRDDGVEFLSAARKAGIRPSTTTYRLEDANVALNDLRTGRVHGAAVLVP